jgi:hypothetical protein
MATPPSPPKIRAQTPFPRCRRPAARTTQRTDRAVAAVVGRAERGLVLGQRAAQQQAVVHERLELVKGDRALIMEFWGQFWFGGEV